MTTPTHTDGLLRELSEDECWARLDLSTVGHVAFVDPHGPVILPFNYIVRDQLVWIRTASYSQLAIHLPGQAVAFEVDHQDEHARTGWSVLLRGRADHAKLGDPRTQGGWPDPAPWPDGIRSMVFCLTPREISGRVVKQRAVDPRVGRGPGTVQRDTEAFGSGA